LQRLLLEIDVAKIILHKADEPNTLINLFDANSLASKRCREIDLFSVDTEPAAVCDNYGFVMERVVRFFETPIGFGGWLINLVRFKSTGLLISNMFSN